MVMKKGVAFLLVTTLVTSGLLTACGGSDSSEKEKQEVIAVEDEIKFPLKEPVTFTVASASTIQGEIPLSDTWVWKTLEEETNVKWEMEAIPVNALSERVNLELSTGQYPDVYLKANAPDPDKYGSQGIYIALNDYIEKYMPNLTALMEKDPTIRQEITSLDGNIYSLPTVKRFREPIFNAYWINEQWLNNLGLEMPTNMDEWYQVLKAFKEQDANGNGDPNDEIPLAMWKATSPWALFPYTGVTIDTVTTTAVKDGELVYYPAMDEYKEFMRFFRKLYEEGLVYKELFTAETNQFTALGNSGDIFGSFVAPKNKQVAVSKEYTDNYSIMPQFVEGTWPVAPVATPGTLVITDTCEHPEIVAAWADQFYSEEGADFVVLGREGETYSKDENGVVEFFQEGYESQDDARRHVGFQGDVQYPGLDSETFYLGNMDSTFVRASKQYFALGEAGAEPFPTLHFESNELKTISTYKADLDAYVSQYLAQVVLGEVDLDATWEEYLTTLNNMGMQDLMQIYKNAYEKVK